MNDELQSESAEPIASANQDDQQSVGETATQSPQEGSGLAPDGDANHSTKIEFSTEQQEVFNREKARDTFKRRKGERQAQQREGELQAEIEKLRASQPVESAPAIPEAPDQFDDNYDQRFQEYQAAVVEKARYDERQSFAHQMDQTRQQDAHLEQQREFQGLQVKFADNGKKLGITPEDMQKNAAVVQSYGLSDQLIMHIAKDSQGPAIAKHLAQNPHDAEKLLSTNSFYLGSAIDEIKGRITHNITKTPAPAETLQGGGVPDKTHPALQGVTFT